MNDTSISSAVREMCQSRYWALPRIAFDLLLWVAMAVAATAIHQSWGYLIAAFVIGVVSMHDLLVQGHEGTHELISRTHVLNELASWLCFAIFGISAAAHKAFHADHHRYPHSDKDPEYRLFNRVVRGVPGWAYLIIPAAAQFGVNIYPFRNTGQAGCRLRVALELPGALVLHALVLFIVGPRNYLLFVLLPMVTGLYLVTVARSICEHHHVISGDDWTNARSIVTSRVTELAWSNVNYHLEHHLYPEVPFHKLPALRRLLAREFALHSSFLGRGFFCTAASLILVKKHFVPDQRAGRSDPNVVQS
jgi:fatty acid desaturase